MEVGAEQHLLRSAGACPLKLLLLEWDFYLPWNKDAIPGGMLAVRRPGESQHTHPSVSLRVASSKGGFGGHSAHHILEKLGYRSI